MNRATNENSDFDLRVFKGLSESLVTRISYFYTLFNPKVRAHGFPVLKKNKKLQNNETR